MSRKSSQAASAPATPRLKLGLPKGSLQDATLEKMAKAGWNVTVSSRSYEPYVDDPDLTIRLIRAQEISRYVELGYLDAGITGHDWIIENHSDVHEVGEFIFSKVSRQATRWVLAVPEESPAWLGQLRQKLAVASPMLSRLRNEQAYMLQSTQSEPGIGSVPSLGWGRAVNERGEL